MLGSPGTPQERVVRPPAAGPMERYLSPLSVFLEMSFFLTSFGSSFFLSSSGSAQGAASARPATARSPQTRIETRFMRTLRLRGARLQGQKEILAGHAREMQGSTV